MPTKKNLSAPVTGDNLFVAYSRDLSSFAHQLYIYYNGKPASCFSVSEINADKFEVLLKKLNKKLTVIFSHTEYDEKTGKESIQNALFRVNDDIYLGCFDFPHFSESTATLYYPPGLSKKTFNAFKKMMLLAMEKGQKAQKIYLLCQEMGDLVIRDFDLTHVDVDLKLHYADSFLEVDQHIRKKLTDHKGKGLVLLHGKPGTGKTTYIRYLTKFIKKKLIYVPPQIANDLSSPAFLPLLAEHPNSVLIIEDAENILQARGSGENAAVSNLLNLADGLLSDCLNIQIICSFNTDLRHVDKALLRKGRLIASYEFLPLEIAKAQKLSNHLGLKTKVSQPMTLAEIYNQHEQFFSLDKKDKIGFSALG